MTPKRYLALIAVAFLGPACAVGGLDDDTKGKTVRQGGTLAVALTPPDQIDPSRASNRSGIFVLKQICDTLVAFEPRTGELKPGIAESWTISADAKKISFKIRQGVKFHNGRDLVAEDFVYSLSRFVHPKTGSPQYFFLRRIVGYQDVRQEKSPTLAGVKATDARTLEIELSEPFAELPAVLSHPSAGAAVPKEEVDKSPEVFAAKPVCTGPYLVSLPWSAGQDINLLRFPNYSATNISLARGGKGYANKIVLRSVPDDEAGYKLFEEKRVQVSNIPVSRLVAARKAKHEVVSGANGHFAYLGLPVTKPPYDNVNMRKALATAVDRKAIVEDLLAGTREIPGSLLPRAAGPAAAGGACPALLRPRIDLNTARTALGASTIDPATVRPVVYFNAGGGHEKWVAKVIEQWQALGITATAEAQPKAFKEHVDFLVDPGADGPFRLAWPVKFPSAEALYDPLFTTGSLDNFTRYASPEFDERMKKARSTVGDKERRLAYAEASAILCRDVPVIPMWFGRNHVVYSSGNGPAGSRALDIYGDPVLRELGFIP